MRTSTLVQLVGLAGLSNAQQAVWGEFSILLLDTLIYVDFHCSLNIFYYCSILIRTYLAQCGGLDWKGLTTCVAGAACVSSK